MFQKYGGDPPDPLLRSAASAAIKLDALFLVPMVTELVYEFEESPAHLVGVCLRECDFSMETPHVLCLVLHLLPGESLIHVRSVDPAVGVCRAHDHHVGLSSGEK